MRTNTIKEKVINKLNEFKIIVNYIFIFENLD